MIDPVPIVQVEPFDGSALPPAPPVAPNWNLIPAALMPDAAVMASNPPPPPMV